jgi:hypothetical protein
VAKSFLLVVGDCQLASDHFVEVRSWENIEAHPEVSTSRHACLELSSSSSFWAPPRGCHWQEPCGFVGLSQGACTPKVGVKEDDDELGGLGGSLGHERRCKIFVQGFRMHSVLPCQTTRVRKSGSQRVPESRCRDLILPRSSNDSVHRSENDRATKYLRSRLCQRVADHKYILSAYILVAHLDSGHGFDQ